MFKGCHFPSEVILETVRYYLAYKLSYREIEEIQRDVVLMWTMQPLIVGLSNLHLFMSIKRGLMKSLYLLRGVWMRPISKSKENGSTTIELSINLETSFNIT